MYTFNNDGSKLLSIEPIDMAKLNSNGEAAYTYTKPFGNTEVGNVYRFLFVANDEVAGATVGMTQEAFEKLPMTKALAADGTSKKLLTKYDGVDVIPMTGMARQGNSAEIAITGTTAPVQVTLTRVVARIDVSNHIPNLTITKLYIRNTYDRTTTFPAKDANGAATYMAPADANKVQMSSGFAEVPANFKGIAGDEGNVLKKAFYLYEGQQPAAEADKDNATTVVVEGTLVNGKSLTIDIPFVSTSASYIPITVKRNYLYNIVLSDDKPLELGSKVVFTIEDTPWNSVILNHDMQIIEIQSKVPEASYTHYDPLTRTLHTRAAYNKSGAEDVGAPFKIITRLKEHKAFTVNFVSSEKGLTYTIAQDAEDPSIFHIYTPCYTCSEVDVESDTAVFEVYSDAYPELKRFLTICYDRNYNKGN